MPQLPPPEPESLRREHLPLRGRTALVTGASRRGGIGYAVARRLAAYGASVYLHHHVPHDRDQPWGADPDGPEGVAAGVREALAYPGSVVAHGPGDLSDPEGPARVFRAARRTVGEWSTSWSPTTPAAARTARCGRSTRTCSTPTGRPTPVP